MFDVTLTNVLSNNNKFYTILFRKGLNNKRQVYTRVYVAYGYFVDSTTFKYNIVYNNKLIDDIDERNCTIDKFLKKNNKEFYVFNNLGDAIRECNEINKDFKKTKIRT